MKKLIVVDGASGWTVSSIGTNRGSKSGYALGFTNREDMMMLFNEENAASLFTVLSVGLIEGYTLYTHSGVKPDAS